MQCLSVRRFQNRCDALRDGRQEILLRLLAPAQSAAFDITGAGQKASARTSVDERGSARAARVAILLSRRCRGTHGLDF